MCSSQCTLPVCGDSIVNGIEECDDGNTASKDGCSSSCENEYCRDDAPLYDTSKNLVITDLTPTMIA